MTWTLEMVMDRYFEAVETLKFLPGDWPRRYFSAMPRFKSEFDRDGAREDLEQSVRAVAGPAAIARLDEVLAWTLWLDGRERIVVWAKAQRAPNRAIQRKIGRGRHTIRRIHLRAMEKIIFRMGVDG